MIRISSASLRQLPGIDPFGKIEDVLEGSFTFPFGDDRLHGRFTNPFDRPQTEGEL